jgi:NDP-sugar pyrophosphorylase family protein
MLAVILAGGRGTRLRPYTTAIPKPLVPVGDRAILEIVLGQLERSGIRQVRLAVSHMAEVIMACIGNGEKYGLEIQYAVEDEPLGTVGGLPLMPDLPENFLVMNGDLLTDIDYGSFLRTHVARGARLTLSTYTRHEKIDFGVLDVNPESGELTGFREKPIYDFDVSMGIYAFHRSVIDRIPRDRPYGLDDLVLAMLADGDPVQTVPFDGYWLDLGRPDDYDRANREVARVFPDAGVAHD